MYHEIYYNFAFRLLVTFICTMIGAAVSFILHFWAEPAPKYVAPESALGDFGEGEGKTCPKLSASFPSELAFSWFDKFAWTGFKRALTKDDLWDLPPELSSRNIVPKFKRYWDPAVQRILKYNTSLPQETNVVANAANGDVPEETKPLASEANGDVSFNATSNSLQINTSKSETVKFPEPSKTKRKMVRISKNMVKCCIQNK